MPQTTILATDILRDTRTDLNTMMTELYAIKTEVENARDGLSNLLAQIDALQADIATLTSSSACPVSSNDTTPGYLNGKLASGTNTSLVETDDGSDESLKIHNTDILGWF